MTFSLERALTIARREYLTTIRRKAFLFTLVGMPLYFGGVMFLSVRPQMSGRVDSLREFHALGVVDSAGVLADAPRRLVADIVPDPLNAPDKRDVFQVAVRSYPDQAAAEAALRSGEVNQALVVPRDYLEHGRVRRYARTSGIFSGAEQRPIERWLARALIGARLDSTRLERAVRPAMLMDLYALDKTGQFVLKDDRRDLFEFLMPFMFAMLLGLSIVIGGQYLLQGVAEEKESRILESLLCTVTPRDLLAGKLLGLGGAGMTMVAAWMAIGAWVGTPMAMILKFHLPPTVVLLAVVYFVMGYLFYGSLMTGIGSLAGSAREAQQLSFVFTFMNFLPMIFLNVLAAKPDGTAARFFSMFPPTAPVAMMLRTAMPGTLVPPWQLAVSLALLAGTAWLALTLSARVFRVALLMYGKTPTLPEILRWMRQS